MTEDKKPCYLRPVSGHRSERAGLVAFEVHWGRQRMPIANRSGRAVLLSSGQQTPRWICSVDMVVAWSVFVSSLALCHVSNCFDSLVANSEGFAA